MPSLMTSSSIRTNGQQLYPVKALWLTINVLKSIICVMSKTNISEVEQVKYGVYLWQAADGRFVGDSEGNYMLIASRKGDRDKIEALRRSAVAHGIDGGHAVFRSGARPVTDAEYEDQVARRESGLVPDKYDLGNLLDEYRFQKGVDRG